jgi:hypothetical protein
MDQPIYMYSKIWNTLYCLQLIVRNNLSFVTTKGILIANILQLKNSCKNMLIHLNVYMNQILIVMQNDSNNKRYKLLKLKLQYIHMLNLIY